MRGVVILLLFIEGKDTKQPPQAARAETKETERATKADRERPKLV
jgi:hypothetical protein